MGSGAEGSGRPAGAEGPGLGDGSGDSDSAGEGDAAGLGDGSGDGSGPGDAVGAGSSRVGAADGVGLAVADPDGDGDGEAAGTTGDRGSPSAWTISQTPTPRTPSSSTATAPTSIGSHHRPPPGSVTGHSSAGSAGSPTGTRARPDQTVADGGPSVRSGPASASPDAGSGTVSPPAGGSGTVSSSSAIYSSMAGTAPARCPKSARRAGSRGQRVAATLPGMTGRGGIGNVAAAAGTAAAAGAAQLGLGYGLGIVNWLPGVGGVLSNDAWVAGLTWAVWISATSVIVGAVLAERLSRPAAFAHGLTALLWRLLLAVAAAIGALVSVALVAVPARSVELADASTPPVVAAGYAALGVLAGLVLAALALAARAVAANLLAAFVWLWGFAVVAVVDRVTTGADEGRVPLGFWDFTAAEPWYRNILLPDAGPVLGAALVIGALTALPAARRGDGPVGVATSGGAGPLLLAAAYLLTQPSLVGVEPLELSRHLVVPYAVLAGLVGSLLAALARPRRTPTGADTPTAVTDTAAVAGPAPTGDAVGGATPLADEPAGATAAPPDPPAPATRPRGGARGRGKAARRSAADEKASGPVPEPTAAT